MATLKFVLQPRAKKDGTHPIRLRILKNGKPAYIPFDKSISKPKLYWDENKGETTSDYANQKSFNKALRSKMEEVENKIIFEIEKKDPECSAQQIVDILSKKTSNLLLERALAWFQKYPKGEGAYDAAECRYKSLKNFIDGKNIRIEDVDISFVEAFEVWCRDNALYASKTTHHNLSFLRAVMIRAVDDGLIEYKDNPFRKYKLKKPTVTQKVPLSIEEIDKIRNMQIPLSIDSSLRDTRNMFIFMFNCAGMRISDALLMKWSSIADGFVSYKMQKTGHWQKLELSPEVVNIISFYKKTTTKPTDYIFPFMDKACPLHPEFTMRKKIKAATKTVNHFLKKIATQLEIKKKISSHVARHSWTQAALNSGASDYMIGLGLGHQDKKTSAQYQNDGFNIPALSAVNKLITQSS